jgi:hypothetical protein
MTPKRINTKKMRRNPRDPRRFFMIVVLIVYLIRRFCHKIAFMGLTLCFRPMLRLTECLPYVGPALVALFFFLLLTNTIKLIIKAPIPIPEVRRLTI